MTIIKTELQSTTSLLREKLTKCYGWEDWMDNWIDVETRAVGNDLLKVDVFVCYHPDMYPFYASTDAQEAVNAFSDPQYCYK